MGNMPACLPACLAGVQLVRDESPAVSARAADLVARLAAHSAVATARLAVGGLEGAAERVLFNPVQQELIDQGGWAGERAGRPGW